MAASATLPADLKTALNNGVLNRLPLTFLPFANQQLREWEYLFPNERRATEQLLLYVNTLSAVRSVALFRDVTELEVKMNVREWKFSTSEQTIENASLLARSPYFQEWRRAVQSVFDAANQHAQSSRDSGSSGNRLVLIEIPQPLELNRVKAWKQWQQIGRVLDLEPLQAGSRGILESMLMGSGPDSTGLLAASARSAQGRQAECWLIDAGSTLINSALAAAPSHPATPHPILLSYSRLDTCRQNFSREMNSIQKNLSDADAVYDRLRKVDVIPWCPPEVATDPATREFVRALYLSGNGAVIFGNSFVQWAASEAFRRARPRFVAARFGMRSKPKPFTGVAVFENPDRVNPIPNVDDLPGSSIDAEILALYIWLAASRFDEYSRSTACICIAESIGQAYIVAPNEFGITAGQTLLSADGLGRVLEEWISERT
jgi:hypothetical protein